MSFKVGHAQDNKYTSCPSPGTGTIGAVDGTTTKTEVTDQNDGASIICAVSSSGSFSATLSQGKTTFSISGSLTGTSGTAVVSVQGVGMQTSAQNAAGMPCTVTIDPKDGALLSAAAGRIYLGFTCPLIQDPNDPAPDVDGCGILGTAKNGVIPPGGFLAVDNCGQ